MFGSHKPIVAENVPINKPIVIMNTNTVNFTFLVFDLHIS